MAVFLWEGKPSRICGQQFGTSLNLENLLDAALAPVITSPHYYRPCRPVSCQNSGSEVVFNKDCFKVSLDVSHFSPEEISVKAVGSDIVVEGKHEEKQDEHGSIYRHFLRKYLLPEGHSPEDIVSKLSSDGQLTITAPKKTIPQSEERVVPIQLTEPHRPQAVKQKL